jgi:hypothetical protein
MKANIFQKGSAGFEAKIDLNKNRSCLLLRKELRKADLISLRQNYRYKAHKGENDRNRQTQTSAGCAQACWHT